MKDRTDKPHHYLEAARSVFEMERISRESGGPLAPGERDLLRAILYGLLAIEQAIRETSAGG
jgi:hypothetical protein